MDGAKRSKKIKLGAEALPQKLTLFCFKRPILCSSFCYRAKSQQRKQQVINYLGEIGIVNATLYVSLTKISRRRYLIYLLRYNFSQFSDDCVLLKSNSSVAKFKNKLNCSKYIKPNTSRALQGSVNIPRVFQFNLSIPSLPTECVQANTYFACVGQFTFQ